jgi:hypothetical protein
MSNAVLKGNASGTGTVTLETPNTNSDRTISLPDAAGTMMVSGNMPAFSAYGSAFQSIANTTYTKIAFSAELFDTNSNYDTTNYRFLPTVAGYYQINATINFSSAVGGAGFIAIYKNGTIYCQGTATALNAGVTQNGVVSQLVSLNGSTDYIEIYGYQSSGGNLNVGSDGTNKPFSGSMLRAA